MEKKFLFVVVLLIDIIVCFEKLIFIDIYREDLNNFVLFDWCKNVLVVKKRKGKVFFKIYDKVMFVKNLVKNVKKENVIFVLVMEILRFKFEILLIMSSLVKNEV